MEMFAKQCLDENEVLHSLPIFQDFLYRRVRLFCRNTREGRGRVSMFHCAMVKKWIHVMLWSVFFSQLYHGTSLLINILIREQMTQNISHFSILHAFNIAGTTMPRLVVEEDTCIFCESTDWGIWPQVMFDCLLSGSWVPEFSSHLCMKFWEVEMFATISSCWDSMWVLSPLQQVVLRLDGISPNLSHNLDLRGERLL